MKNPQERISHRSRPLKLRGSNWGLAQRVGLGLPIQHVLREGRAIAVPSSEAGEPVEHASLHTERNVGEVDLIQVLLEENADLQQRPRREPCHSHKAISLKSEERAEALLAAARRVELDPEVRDTRADVSEAVWRSRLNDQDVAGAEGEPSQPEPEAQFAGHTLEPLPLASVDVRWDEAAGPHEEVGRDTPRRALAEDDALARDRVGDCIYGDRVYTGLDHLL
jgi:hypothetical protein